MSAIKELKDEIAKPIPVPQINIAPIELPVINQQSHPSQQDWIDGFFITAGHTLRSFPLEVAEDVVDEFGEILKKTRKRLREDRQ